MVLFEGGIKFEKYNVYVNVCMYVWSMYKHHVCRLTQNLLLADIKRLG